MGPSHYLVWQQGWRSTHTGRGHTGQEGQEGLGGQDVQLVLSLLEDQGFLGVHLSHSQVPQVDLAQEDKETEGISHSEAGVYPGVKDPCNLCAYMI